MMRLRNRFISTDIAPTGAWITSLQMEGVHFLFPRELVEVDGKPKFRGGCHICSPIFGTGKGKFAMIPNHGGMRELKWDETSRRDSSMEFTTRYDVHGFRLWYLLEFKVYLNEFSITTGIKNQQRENAPVQLAWHPYFNAPNGASIIMPNGPVIKINGPHAAEIFPWDGRALRVILPGIGYVDLKSSGGYSYRFVCIWTDWLRNYVCVEPLVFDPNDPDYGLLWGHIMSPKLTMQFTCI